MPHGEAVLAIDEPALRAWWGQCQTVDERLRRARHFDRNFRPPPIRPEGKRPSLGSARERALFERDGYRCRYCGIPVPCGEAVLLVHGAIVADSFAPMLDRCDLRAKYQVITYHRRGFCGSAPA
jgi:hypothetical protein